MAGSSLPARNPARRSARSLRRRVLATTGIAGLLCLCAASAPAADQHRGAARHPVGLGAVLTTKNNQEIYGFDINQSGADGVLASAGYQGNNFVVSMETFDQDTGKIVKSFATNNPARNSYGVDGIFAGDVGLITHYIIPKGQIYAKRQYDVMDPVTANAFTGSWTPPIKDVDVQLAAENQATSTSVLFAIELKKQDRPVLFVSDIADNTFSNVITLDPNLFCGCNGPQLGQFTAANKAVFALSPDGGAVGGEAPVNVIVDLATGKTKQFNGYNTGPYHAGYVNGLAVDPNTGVGATDTELNAQVEFYDMGAQAAINDVQLPCTGDADQGSSGSGIAVDPVNKLFFVTETYNACGNGSDSAIIVYDESGNVVETLTGFKFFIGEPPPVLNPSKRMGWAFGGPNGWSQLQQFFY
jgi:hypothetical protein